jgi:hypothetical protein
VRLWTAHNSVSLGLEAWPAACRAAGSDRVVGSVEPRTPRPPAFRGIGSEIDLGAKEVPVASVLRRRASSWPKVREWRSLAGTQEV